MDLLVAVADQVIRRALGFVALGIMTLMLALSFDPALALRSGGVIAGAAWVGLLLSARRAPGQEFRHTEFGATLTGLAGVGPLDAEARRRAMLLMRDRLLWHADRAAAVSALLFLLGYGIALIRG